jgi:hypothetical protein
MWFRKPKIWANVIAALRRFWRPVNRIRAHAGLAFLTGGLCVGDAQATLLFGLSARLRFSCPSRRRLNFLYEVRADTP